MWQSLTAQPEDPNRIHAATENAGKPAATSLCYRYGCTRLRDIPGAVNLQQTVRVPCGKPKEVPRAEEYAGTWVAEARCLGARDCIGGNGYFPTREAAEEASKPWRAKYGPTSVTIRPLRKGEEILY